MYSTVAQEGSQIRRQYVLTVEPQIPYPARAAKRGEGGKELVTAGHVRKKGARWPVGRVPVANRLARYDTWVWVRGTVAASTVYGYGRRGPLSHHHQYDRNTAVVLGLFTSGIRVWSAWPLRLACMSDSS